VAAPDFLKSEETERDFLEPKLLAAGSITQCFSPRGLGKTHVAHALQVKHAVAGKRVLLIDRDNSRREVKRRLRTWGADAARTLKVLTRENAPALTDRAAWAAFPFTEYDLITIDSIDSATEGVGEGDSAKPSKALASILDIAHREAGPAILVLGNTIKSAAHSRGSGVVEDRADIVFEVRDATDLRPTGTKDWWHELPPAGVDAWAQRASRRKKREVYRLAFRVQVPDRRGARPVLLRGGPPNRAVGSSGGPPASSSRRTRGCSGSASKCQEREAPRSSADANPSLSRDAAE
jgi:hypothetical protein